MLVIRMRQQGSNNNRQFRIVVTDQRAPRDGAYIENLGWYNPYGEEGKNCEINMERLPHWVNLGAQMTDRVKHLIKRKLMAPEKLAAVTAAHTEYKKVRRAKPKAQG